MSPAAERLKIARTAALLALASLAVHQLRYLVAFGADSGRELHEQGHSYLAQSLPILLALAGAAIAARLLAGAASAYPGAGAAGSTLARGLRYGLAIFCVFSVQELAEGALSPGHPAGVLALVGSGAWLAAPLAVVVGLFAAAVENLLDRAETALATVLGIVQETRYRTSVVASGRPAPRSAPLAARALAFGFARRPPPVTARS